MLENWRPSWLVAAEAGMAKERAEADGGRREG